MLHTLTQTLTPVFEPILLEKGAQQEMLKGLSFSKTSKTFNFKGAEVEDLGTYEVGIRFYYKEFTHY